MPELPPRRRVQKKRRKSKEPNDQNIAGMLYAPGPARKNPYKYSHFIPYIWVGVFAGLALIGYPLVRDYINAFNSTAVNDAAWNQYQIPDTPISFHSPVQLESFDNGAFNYWYQEYRENNEFYILSVGYSSELDPELSTEETLSRALTAIMGQCKGSLDKDERGDIRGKQGTQYYGTLLRNGRKVIREGQLQIHGNMLIDVACSYHGDHRPEHVVNRFLNSVSLD